MAWAVKLQQNLPPQILLSDPVVLYDALDGHFPFFLEYITCAEVSINPRLTTPYSCRCTYQYQEFVEIIERRTHKTLEDKYKDHGAAKIRTREFLLQDLESRRRFDLKQQPWNFVMKPGKKRHMSVTFRDSSAVSQSCPHCGTDNETVEELPTNW
jgi:hypothetical protein